ncbi:hexose kinase [Pseudarthrobacter psychrotolerans]|uniref:Hexose kinase n=1 Tax=Pseudarthrobacter psychrotolerans TaxID=2697569 RepID=A0A6P1NS15_9MICC|nr:1-phosphofructokinase family hexose kinase [Pseudarthrobacter psychrotolerans]QHK20322.1 hexose kinase [Pseudarthrobacter psychrotolerans]
MKRIVTVTPSPAVDMTYQVQRITPGSTHRVAAPLIRAGGKGLNVARVAHQLGFPVLALAPAGSGAAGAEFKAELSSSGMPHRIIPVEADTRRSIAVVDTSKADTIILNEPGAYLSAAEWHCLRVAVKESLASGEGILVGSGSLPAGADPDFYASLVALAHEAGIRAIIDTSGPGMVSAARAGADLIKPNHHELREATGEDDPVVAARQLIGMGAQRVMVSSGAAGMMIFDAADPATYWHARLPYGLGGNPTGAGDAAVAAAAACLSEGSPDSEQILRAATAWSAAAVLMPAAGEISPQYEELADQLIVTQKEIP